MESRNTNTASIPINIKKCTNCNEYKGYGAYEFVKKDIIEVQLNKKEEYNQYAQYNMKYHIVRHALKII